MQERVSLAPFTSWRVGGPARYFLEPTSEEELLEALQWVRSQDLPWQVLGRGSNLLVADEGFDGLVVRLAEKYGRVRVEGDRIVAQAGASLSGVVKAAATAELGGGEFLATIPGSVGGALAMNAGAHGGTTSDVLREARLLLPDGRVVVRQGEELAFAYRKSCVRPDGAIVLEATFQFVPAPGDQVRAKVNELLRWRKAHQPVGPSCGSVFRNPEGTSAGRLLEDLGAKGMAEGKAQVSEVHANFIVNQGGATAGQIDRLIRRLQELALAERQIWLHPEVVGVGLSVGLLSNPARPSVRP